MNRYNNFPTVELLLHMPTWLQGPLLNVRHFFVVEVNSSQITLTIIAHGGIEGEIPRRHPNSSSVYVEKYLQLKYTISKPEKISLYLIRGSMESL